MNLNRCLLYVCDRLIEKRDELCELDGYVGDGDHGVTIERGFKAASEAIRNRIESQGFDNLKTMNEVLSESMGGAIGPIMGSFFGGGARKLKGCEVNAENIGVMLNEGLKRIQLIGGAKEGDSTLVDALVPACKAYAQALTDGKDLDECLTAAAEAAEKGAENTRNMVATHGRAKFLQEKSMGYMDAGAVSMSLILKAMSAFAKSEQ